jgi:hypothetical protein
LHKPLADTFWSRLKQLFRGLIFYNTIYWKRASDGLNPPRMTSEERRKLAPPKDYGVIKPREKPRARIDEVKRREMLAELAQLRRKMPAAAAGEIPASLPVEAAAAATTPTARPIVVSPVPSVAPSGSFHRSPPPAANVVKRRRKRRASHQPEDPSATGFLGRLLAKWTR